ncbi:hypothetical protein LCGC14_1547620 [marine sediment metagenome]|uniref:Uncharacterized protein n=1 Tax=marine sediment metagenome TaxID=412755 RepID=A0A0F9IR89_9ZZZZ
MKGIDVVIGGTSEGLLMHSAQGMVKQGVKKNPAKLYDPKEDAEAVAYRNDKGELYVPSRCLKASILNAAAWLKVGKKSLKPIIAGCTRIEPSEIVLTDRKGKALKEYKIDVRRVVVQRAGIMRARPLLKEWQLKFNIIYDETLIGKTPEELAVIKDVLEDAGKRIGLLDNRPQKYGENGTFEVIKFLPKR